MSGETPRRAVWIVVPIAVVMMLLFLLLATREQGTERDSGVVGKGQLAPSIVGLDSCHWWRVRSRRSAWPFRGDQLFFDDMCALYSRAPGVGRFS